MTYILLAGRLHPRCHSQAKEFTRCCRANLPPQRQACRSVDLRISPIASNRFSLRIVFVARRLHSLSATMWIVRVALNRPYTFIVVALLILILAPVVILRTPTDIFPDINIPVIAVAWQYTGLNPEEMEGRITTVFERVLTTLVDNIEHIESVTVNGQSFVEIYLQPNASLDTANAQVTAEAQNISSPVAGRHAAASDSEFQRVLRTHSPVGPFRASRTGSERYRAEFPEAATRHGPRRLGALSLWKQAAATMLRYPGLCARRPARRDRIADA